MPPDNPDTGQRRCPICWTWFTPNAPTNPHPQRYCSGACRIEDSRRRHDREQTQQMLDAYLALIRDLNNADAQRRAATQTRRQNNERRPPMTPD